MSAFGKSIFEKKNMKLNLDEKKGFITMAKDFKDDPKNRQFALFTQKNTKLQAMIVVDEKNQMITGNFMHCGNNQRTKMVFEHISFLISEEIKKGGTYMDLVKNFEKEVSLATV